jgi:hypothetical protein
MHGFWEQSPETFLIHSYPQGYTPKIAAEAGLGFLDNSQH